MAKILVIIEKRETSYGAYSPDVPGCVAVGDTREEVEQRMREALRLHLELMRDEHLPHQRYLAMIGNGLYRV
jgi:predicted RNase H-like HicB family nuclease